MALTDDDLVLLDALRTRFHEPPQRNPELAWAAIVERLAAAPALRKT